MALFNDKPAQHDSDQMKANFVTSVVDVVKLVICLLILWWHWLGGKTKMLMRERHEPWQSKKGRMILTLLPYLLCVIHRSVALELISSGRELDEEPL